MGKPMEFIRQQSLRTQLIVVLLILMMLALLCASAAAIGVLRSELIGRVDQDLRWVSDRDVGRTLSHSQDGRSAPPSLYDLTVFSARGVEQSHIFSASTPEDRPALDALIKAAQSSENIGKPFTVTAEAGDERFRVLLLKIRDRDFGDTGLFIAVAIPLANVDHTILSMKTGLAIIGLIVLVAAAAIGSLIIRLALAPLAHVGQVASAVGAGNTSKRVDNVDSSKEVAVLGSSVNHMLDRIEATLAQREDSETKLRQFVADASHELRTPLASIRGFAELYRMGAVNETPDIKRSFERIESEATRLGILVEDLLMLARLDQHKTVDSTRVDLFSLATDAVHDATAREPDRSIFVRSLSKNSGPQPVWVMANEGHMRQVLTNLVSNALRHTPPESAVEVAVGATADSHAILSVIDHGHGIPPEHVDKIFSRFYRIDSSRTRGAGGGAGLGLAIVTAIVRSYGGTIAYSQTPGGGATFTVKLPEAPEETPS